MLSMRVPIFKNTQLERELNLILAETAFLGQQVEEEEKFFRSLAASITFSFSVTACLQNSYSAAKLFS